MSAAIFFFALDYFFSDTLLHLLRVVDVPIRCKRSGGVAETHLYLFRADLLLGEERRVRVAERMEAQIGGQVQPLLEVGEDVRHCIQSNGFRIIFARSEDVKAVYSEWHTICPSSW